MKRAKTLMLLIIVALFSGQLSQTAASAQDKGSKRPIDMEILIDNSCSMFPSKQILPGCDASGADPDFLRIAGANLFIARLGFGELDEDQYQLGVIGVGDTPQKISPLQPLSEIRDELARKVQNPLPAPATKLIPALELAYTELGKSSFASHNQPAVVLITDGIPWPRETQSNAEIEKLLSVHSEVPVFVMLLANPARKSTDFDNYVQFWESLQARYTNIVVYKISGPSKIQDTYNQILGILQNTVTAQGVSVNKGGEIRFFIGHYTQKVIVTAIRKAGTPPGSISIRDPKGLQVAADQGGIKVFSGKDNPVEVFTIESPRLSDELKGMNWTVLSSAPATIFIDRMGSYSINFLNPPAIAIDVANQYVSLERESPSRDFTFQFNLIDESGKPVLDQQLIRGSIQPPVGTPIALPAQGLQPDNQGTYSLPVNAALLFPRAASLEGRYTFLISAGVIDESNPESPAITSAWMYVDFGHIPVIRSIAPISISCEPGLQTELRVTVAELAAGAADKISIQARKDNLTVLLDPKGDGLFRGDISPICQALVTSLGCSRSQNLSFTVRMDAALADGTVLTPVERQVDARVTGLACTQTPAPTATLLPTPAPTRVPDRDQDGVIDISDRCPLQWGFEPYEGCFPWAAVWGGSGFFLVFGVLGMVLWPWVQVTRISPPPPAYLVACRDGVTVVGPVALHTVGRSKRTMHISIGSGRRAAVQIKGLAPVEFIVEWRSGLVSMRDPGEKEPFVYFGDTKRVIRTSDPRLTLRISQDPDGLRC